MEMGTTKKMGAKGSLQERLWQLLPRSYLVPKCQFGLSTSEHCFKNKYGGTFPLPAYEEILSLEQPEEYADVKSKAPAWTIRR